MPARGKYFELLDLPKFGRPNVVDIDANATSRELFQRLGDGGFMSYGPIWTRLRLAFSGLADDRFVKAAFSFYPDEWKNENLREVFTMLRDYFGGRGRWYPAPSDPLYVLGFWFKPSIKGIWFVDGRAYAVAVNPRKGQPLSTDDVRFIMRGVHELHCVDDPNDPVPLILDLAAQSANTRQLRAFRLPMDAAVSLNAFEHSLRQFVEALTQVGLAMPAPPDVEHLVDLFKR